ncbi:MAG: hypothetical protein K6D03_05615 [Solobacterium sp.]|nr:hypothetical protein [Solobacterium sp.]
MIRRLIMAAVVSAAAVAATMLYTKQNEKDEEKDKKIEDDADEIRFIDLEQENEEKEAEKPEQPEESESVKEISELYPYLGTKFIAEQFVRNEAFNEQYPEDTLITITHKVKFEDIDLLSQFISIAEDSGYTAAALNEKEFTVSKKMFTENGSILSDIYNIANQTACLKGTYEGYNIEA